MSVKAMPSAWPSRAVGSQSRSRFTPEQDLAPVGLWHARPACVQMNTQSHMRVPRAPQLRVLGAEHVVTCTGNWLRAETRGAGGSAGGLGKAWGDSLPGERDSVRRDPSQLLSVLAPRPRLQAHRLVPQSVWLGQEAPKGAVMGPGSGGLAYRAASVYVTPPTLSAPCWASGSLQMHRSGS